MNSFAIQPESKKPTREEGLAIAAQRKAARGRRTGRIRKAVAVVAVSAFIGPFAFIYSQMAAGKDPALAATQAVASNASSSLGQGRSSATAAASRQAAAKKAAAAARALARRKEAAAAAAAAEMQTQAAAGSTSSGSTGSTSTGSTSSGSSSSPAAVTTQQS